MHKELLDRKISRYLHEFVADNKKQQEQFVESLMDIVYGEKKAEFNQVTNFTQGFIIEPSDHYLTYLSYDESSCKEESLQFYRLCLSNAIVREFLEEKSLDIQTQFSSVLEAAIEVIGRIWVYCNQNSEDQKANQLLLNHKACLTDWLSFLAIPDNSDQGSTALSAADAENEIK